MASANDFGTRLSIAVEEAGISQGEVARRVNAVTGGSMTGSYVGRMMRGDRGDRVEPATLFALADAVNVEARWLWLGMGPKRLRMVVGR